MINTIRIKGIASFVSVSFSKIKAIWEPLWRILTFSPADDIISRAKNTSVSIEKGILSVAYGSRFLSQIRIKGFKTYPVEDRYPTPEGLASSVTLALSHLRTPISNITLNIPKAWAIIKTAEFPSTVKDNISDVVAYEMDRVTPFIPEEAYYDFKVIKEEGERLTVLVAAVKADLIDPYIRALSEKGFTVSVVTLNLSSIGTLCRYIDKSTDFIYVKMDEYEYEGAVFTNGFVTGAFTGSLAPGDERLHLDTIMEELEPLIEGVKKRGNTPKVIASLKGRNPAFREMLKLRLNTPVRMLDESDMKLGLSMKEIPYEAVGGLLESLWPKAKRLNLLKKGYQEKEKSPVAFTVILTFTLLVMWVAYIFAPIRIEEKRLTEIGHQIAMRKAEVRKVEALKKEIETLEAEVSTVSNFKESRPMTLNILKEFTSILPKTTWLTRVRITETTAEIEGYASSASELLPKLEASKYFKKAEFASPTFRDVRMNADRFNIKMEIEGVKKEEGEKPKYEKK